MIPNTQQREVVDGGVSTAVAFGISQKNSGWIMRILRDGIYSDKLLAVLREYGANAWDAHRMVGKNDVPIKVTLPTEQDRILRIRDFGPGLSKESVLEIYTQYGESTKRCDNNAVGMLGIGCKSGFAYADNFTVTSWHAGTVRIFVASMDAKGDCFMKMLSEEPCDEAETGVEVSLAIRADDVYDCTSKARGLYRYFTPQPEINTTLEPLPTPMASGKLTNGTLWHGHNSWTALMGCVPYPVSTSQLGGVDGYDYRMLSSVAGVLFFKVGDLEINASREGLAYDDATKKALVNKLNDLVEEYVKQAIKDIETSGGTEWSKRLKGQSLRTMGLPVPDRCKALCEHYVHLKEAFKAPQEKPRTFDLINQAKCEASYLLVEPTTRILWRDDLTKTIVGYQLGGQDLIVRPSGDHTLDEAKQEFAEICKALKIEGIPTADLSTVAWYPPPEKKKRAKNSKHTVRTFRLLPTARDYKPYSEHWETETEREPTKNDVFVLISNFKDTDPSVNFYNQYTSDKALCDAFGYTMPEVYGYKTSEKKPVDPKKCKGTEYKAWRKKLIAEICAKPDVARQLMHYEWQRNAAFGDGYYSKLTVAHGHRNAETHTKALLGDKHPITRWVVRALSSDRFVRKLPKVRQQYLPTLYNRTNNLNDDSDTPAESECVKKMGEIEAVYPLFAVNNDESFSVIWNKHDEEVRKRWAEYVKLVDTAKKAGVQI